MDQSIPSSNYFFNRFLPVLNSFDRSSSISSYNPIKDVDSSIALLLLCLSFYWFALFSITLLHSVHFVLLLLYSIFYAEIQSEILPWYAIEICWFFATMIRELLTLFWCTMVVILYLNFHWLWSSVFVVEDCCIVVWYAEWRNLIQMLH